MWATKPIKTRVLHNVIYSGESENYWMHNNKALVEQGLPPNITHADMETSQQLTRHIYGKQSHDGCLMFGGHRKVE